MRDRVLPAIDEVLGEETVADRELRFAALQGCLDRSIATMTDPAHRAAAAELLGSGPHRWQPLTRRGPRAASAFQLGWDAYRRRRESTGASLLDETLDELSATILGAGGTSTGDVHERGAANDETLTAVDATDASADAPRRFRRIMVAVAVAVLAVAGATLISVVAGAVRSDTDPVDAEGDSTSCGRLTAKPGDVVTEATDEVRRWSEPFRAAAAKDPDIMCAGPIQAREGTIFQQITWGTDDSTGILLAPTDPGAEVIILNSLEYRRFRTSAWDVYFPNRRLGLPLRREDERSDGARIVSFANGVIVQTDERDVAFSVTDRMYEYWAADGGPDGEMCLPYSNRYERSEIGSTQDFATGRIVIDYVDGGEVVERWGPTDHVPAEELRGNIVRTPSGESWFVSDAGDRRWLPTDDDHVCVQNSRDAEVIDVSTAVVVELPVGEMLRCL